MFIYAIRNFGYFRQPAVSVAILCDQPNPATRHLHNLPYTHLNFEFVTASGLSEPDSDSRCQHQSVCDGRQSPSEDAGKTGQAEPQSVEDEQVWIRDPWG
jgi:hypothetical protein